MKCALVWRNGYAELRVMQCNADEFEYLKKQIGKSVEVEIRPTQPALDGAGVAPEGGVYKIEWVDADTIRLTPRQ